MIAKVEYHGRQTNAEIRITGNGKEALVIDATSALAAYQRGDEITVDGQPRIVDGIGKRFKINGNNVCYMYMQGVKTQEGQAKAYDNLQNEGAEGFNPYHQQAEPNDRTPMHKDDMD